MIPNSGDSTGSSPTRATNGWICYPPPAVSPNSVPIRLAEVLDAVGGAIDSLGGRFTMYYTTLAATAVRVGAS